MTFRGVEAIADNLEALPRCARKFASKEDTKQPIWRIGRTHAPGLPQAHGARRDAEGCGALLDGEAMRFAKEPEPVRVAEVATGRARGRWKFLPL